MARRVTIIAPTLIWPVNNGSRVDIYSQIVALLNDGFLVHLICITVGDAEFKQIEFHKNLRIYNIKANSRWSFRVDNNAKRFVTAHLKDWSPDLLIFQYPDMLPYLIGSGIRRNRLIYRSHNSEFSHYLEKNFCWLFQKGFEARPSPKKMILALKEAAGRFFLDFSAKIVAGTIFFIGKGDYTAFLSRLLFGHKSSWVVSPLSYVHGKPRNNIHPIKVFFSGSDLQSVVNENALNFIKQNLSPELERVFGSKVHIYISGYNGDSLGILPQNVTYLGFADNYQRLLEEMHIFISPVNIGWGCKIKILEALAAGLPVLAHPASLRGIGQNGFSFCCKTPKEYSEAISDLMKEEFRNKIGDEGIRFLDVESAKFIQKIRYKLNELP